MILNVKRAVTAIAFFTLLDGMTACMPGSATTGGGRPVRKKLLTPDLQPENCNTTGFVNSGRWEQAPEGVPLPPLPFYITDTTIALGGNNFKYYLLRVPGPEFDFLLPMVKTYEAYLSSLIGYWPMMNHDGLAIDLSAGKATGQARFQLLCAGQEVPVPLVIMWDEASAGRVAYISRFLETLSSIRCEGIR